MAHRQYRIYGALGRKVLASPTSPWALRRVALARYQPHTWRQTLFQRAARVAMLLGVDRLVSRKTLDPIGESPFRLDDWVARVSEALGERDLTPVIMWPPQADRGRFYVHLIDRRMKAVGFAKVSLNAKNDDCLTREREVLAVLDTHRSGAFRAPGILTTGMMAGHSYLVLEPIPDSARPPRARTAAFPASCVREYAGEIRTVTTHELTRIGWWKVFLQRIHSAANDDAPVFYAELCDLLGRYPARLCRVHGDFTIANILFDGPNSWILDWEEYDSAGPALVDEMTFFFSKCRARRIPLSRVFGDFLRERGAGGSQERLDAMLALAFRYRHDFLTSSYCVNNWKRQ